MFLNVLEVPFAFKFKVTGVVSILYPFGACTSVIVNVPPLISAGVNGTWLNVLPFSSVGSNVNSSPFGLRISKIAPGSLSNVTWSTL